MLFQVGGYLGVIQILHMQQTRQKPSVKSEAVCSSRHQQNKMSIPATAAAIKKRGMSLAVFEAPVRGQGGIVW